MTLPRPINPSQTDAKSPVDDNLMDSIREDLNFLDSTATSGGVPTYPWVINGNLANLPNRIGKRLDMQFLHAAQQFSRLRLAQEVSGDSGVTEIDIRYHTRPNIPIVGIAQAFQANVAAVAPAYPSLTTQSITRVTPNINTQSITRAKPTLSITSIIQIGPNLWNYNLSAAPDADYALEDYVVVDGATNTNNNGTFTIKGINRSGFPSITLQNGVGVAQPGAAGSLNVQIYSYNFVDPVNPNFVPGEYAGFFGHTKPDANNYNYTIYAVNRGGNNIWIKLYTDITQPGAAGYVSNYRWAYNYLAPTPSYVTPGQTVFASGHTQLENNLFKKVVAINQGGNNLVVYNTEGVAQAGPAGTIQLYLVKYTLDVNPATAFSVNDKITFMNGASSQNDGTFPIAQMNYLTNDNVVIYNPNFFSTGAGGIAVSPKKLIRFATDMSAFFTLDSYIEMREVVDPLYNANHYTLPLKVLQINRGGGANYNVVVEVPGGATQLSPAGYVEIEGKSIFVAGDGVKPQLAAELVGTAPKRLLQADYSSASLKVLTVPANTYLGLYVLRVQSGSPKNLSVMLS